MLTLTRRTRKVHAILISAFHYLKAALSENRDLCMHFHNAAARPRGYNHHSMQLRVKLRKILCIFFDSILRPMMRVKTILSVLSFALSLALTPAFAAPPPYDERKARVIAVVDGDTISVLISEFYERRVRYIGIDAPEMRRDCFGPEATAANRRLVLGKVVALERDVSDTDRFGRLLRYVYLPTGEMVNEVLVREGYALARSFPPDTKYRARFEAAERQARQANAGLWGACRPRPTQVVPSPTPPLPPPPSPTPAQTAPTLIVVSEFLNVRAGPGTAYPKIGELARFARVPALARSADGRWWQIAYGNDTGWVSADYVVEDQGVLALPTVQPPTSPPAYSPSPRTPPPAAGAASPAPTLPPPPPVAAGCPTGCVERPAGCDIKGNVNNRGERIYHVPGGQFYDKTSIDPSRGDRWFCSPAEAEANGFRPSKR
jgi:endonuclease YncB( thermonuclease family)